MQQPADLLLRLALNLARNVGQRVPPVLLALQGVTSEETLRNFEACGIDQARKQEYALAYLTRRLHPEPAWVANAKLPLRCQAPSQLTARTKALKSRRIQLEKPCCSSVSRSAAGQERAVAAGREWGWARPTEQQQQSV